MARWVWGSATMRAGFFSRISFRLASLRTADTTVRYFWAVASRMGFPWQVRFRSSASRFSMWMGRRRQRGTAPMYGYTASSIRR